MNFYTNYETVIEYCIIPNTCRYSERMLINNLTLTLPTCRYSESMLINNLTLTLPTHVGTVKVC